MPAKVQDLVIEQGVTFSFPVKLAIDTAGTPFSLTGWTGQSQARRNVRDSNVLFSFTVAISDPANGLFSLSLTADQTRGLNFNTAVYDVELTSPLGGVVRIMTGRLSLSREVTR